MYIYSIYAHYDQSPYSKMEGSLRLESKLTVTRQVVEIATRAIFIFFTRIMIVRWLLNEVCINTMGRPYFSTGEQLEYLQNKDAICMTKTTQVPVWMWCIHTYRRHICLYFQSPTYFLNVLLSFCIHKMLKSACLCHSPMRHQ